MQVISRMREPVQKLGEQVIGGVQFDILDEGAYYDLPTIEGDELVGHAPAAEAFFGIKPGSKHTIEMGYTPGFASGDGDYEPGMSFISVTDRSHPNYNETFQYDLSVGDPAQGLDPSASKSRQEDRSRNQLADPRTKEDKARDALTQSLGAMGSHIELADDLQDFISKPPAEGDRIPLDKEWPPEYDAEIAGSDRDFTLADAKALKEIVDFAHRKMLEEPVNPSA